MKFYEFDPIDAGIIIHEQAINLGSQQPIMDANDLSDDALKRWKIPQLTSVLGIDGVIGLLISSCLVFFKFRIVSKQAINEYSQ